MKKYYTSHIDFSEIANITVNSEQLQSAHKRLQELNLITEKGNPSASNIASMTLSLSKSFFIKLQKRLRNRNGGIAATRDILKYLYSRKEYYGFFMYITFLYGFLEWQVPEKIMLLPAAPDALKCYCTEVVSALDKYIEDNIQNVEVVADNEANS